VAIVVVVVVVLGFVGYKMFMGGKSGGGAAVSTSNRDAYFKDHPEAKKAMENMSKGGQPPPGSRSSSSAGHM
jgi:hypothetical protein